MGAQGRQPETIPLSIFFTVPITQSPGLKRIEASASHPISLDLRTVAIPTPLSQLIRLVRPPWRLGRQLGPNSSVNALAYIS